MFPFCQKKKKHPLRPGAVRNDSSFYGGIGAIRDVYYLKDGHEFALIFGVGFCSNINDGQ